MSWNINYRKERTGSRVFNAHVSSPRDLRGAIWEEINLALIILYLRTNCGSKKIIRLLRENFDDDGKIQHHQGKSFHLLRL